MLLEDFSYDLPNELIAQRPLPRGSERLMVVDRKTGGIEHSSFDMLDDYLRSGDSLVMNDSRVIPARLLGRKKTGGKVEVFLLKKLDGERWKCLAKSSKPPVPETVVYFDSGLKCFF